MLPFPTKPTFLLIGLSTLGGCASIISGSDATVELHSSRERSFQITNHGETIMTGVAPDVVVLPRSIHAEYLVSWDDGEKQISGQWWNINGWTVFGNPIFGGLIGVGVDICTGAAAGMIRTVDMDECADQPQMEQPKTAYSSKENSVSSKTTALTAAPLAPLPHARIPLSMEAPVGAVVYHHEGLRQPFGTVTQVEKKHRFTDGTTKAALEIQTADGQKNWWIEEMAKELFDINER